MRLSVKLNPAWRRQLAVDDRRFWLLRSAALHIEISASPRWLIEIYYKRLLLVLVALVLAFYLAAVSGLHYWLARNPHNQVGWSDLALPWRWGDVRPKLGDTAVLDAEEGLKKRDYVAAYLNLRVGVARAPGNARGRALLARLLAPQEPVRALELMEEGLRLSARDVDFLRSLTSHYQFHQATARAVATFDRLLAPPAAALPAKTRDYLATARAALLLEAGRPADALQALTVLAKEPAPGPDDRRVRRLVEIAALSRLGRAGEARVLLDQRPAGLAAPGADELRIAAEVALALADTDRLQSALRRLKAASPGSPSPYVFAFECWHRLKRASLRDAAEAEFYEFFGGNDAALQLFAVTLVNLGLDDALARVRFRALAARLSGFAFSVYLTESCLRRGEFEQATRLLRDWERGAEKLNAAQSFYPGFIKRLTRAAFHGKEEQADALVHFLEENRPQIRPALCQFAADVLVRAGQLDLSDRILRLGQTRFPFSDPLLALRTDLDRRLAAARAAQPKAPVPVLTEPGVGPPLPATADEALAALDAMLQQDSLTAARDLLRRLRQANPRWLSDHEAAVGVREIALSLAADEPLASRALVRRHLARFSSDEAALQLVALARKLATDQRLPGARLLHDEVRLARGASAPVAAALAAMSLPDDLAEAVASREAALRALDERLAAARWLEAERLFGRLEDARPEWLAGAQVDLLVRRVRLLLGLDQKQAALLRFRELALPSGAARSAAFRLVRDCLARGERVPAQLLAAEVARLLPGDSAAAKLLQEAQVGHPPGEL